MRCFENTATLCSTQMQRISNQVTLLLQSDLQHSVAVLLANATHLKLMVGIPNHLLKPPCRRIDSIVNTR
jgi:hypothetical protein